MWVQVPLVAPFQRENMPRKYQEYTDTDLINAVANAKSLSDVCRAIDIKPIGGNITTVKRKIQKLNLNIDHFTSQGWKCELCQNETWQQKPIPLECHHIDKDRTNNDESNLQLLCRNCHFVIHNKK